jgi:hypothetical protein
LTNIAFLHPFAELLDNLELEGSAEGNLENDAIIWWLVQRHFPATQDYFCFHHHPHEAGQHPHKCATLLTNPCIGSSSPMQIFVVVVVVIVH